MDACYTGGCGLLAALSFTLQPFVAWMTEASAAVAEKAPWLFPFLAAIAGASAASLVGLIVHRLPRIRGWNGRHDASLGLATPASHCDACGAPVPVLALVPVAGWFLSEGRCGGCGSRVPWIYPAVEAATGVASLVVVALCGPGLPALILLVLGWWLLFVAWIDWNEHEIPDAATLPLLFMGLLWTPFEPDVHARIVGAALAGLFVMLAFRITASLRKGDTMSLGDIGLAGALGGWLGVCAVPPFLLASCAAYVAYAYPLRTRGRVWVPMGPALCLGFVACALTGLRAF